MAYCFTGKIIINTSKILLSTQGEVLSGFQKIHRKCTVGGIQQCKNLKSSLLVWRDERFSGKFLLTSLPPPILYPQTSKVFSEISYQFLISTAELHHAFPRADSRLPTPLTYFSSHFLRVV